MYWTSSYTEKEERERERQTHTDTHIYVILPVVFKDSKRRRNSGMPALQPCYGSCDDGSCDSCRRDTPPGMTKDIQSFFFFSSLFSCVDLSCLLFFSLILYKCNGLPSLCSFFFATRVTAEFAQFTGTSTEDKSSDIIYRNIEIYKYCYIFSQAKLTIDSISLPCYHQNTIVDEDD